MGCHVPGLECLPVRLRTLLAGLSCIRAGVPTCEVRRRSLRLTTYWRLPYAFPSPFVTSNIAIEFLAAWKVLVILADWSRKLSSHSIDRLVTK